MLSKYQSFMIRVPPAVNRWCTKLKVLAFLAHYLKKKQRIVPQIILEEKKARNSLTRSDALPNQTPADQLLLHAPANQLPKIGCCQARGKMTTKFYKAVPVLISSCNLYYAHHVLLDLGKHLTPATLHNEQSAASKKTIVKPVYLSSLHFENIRRMMLRINKWCSFLSKETISIN